MSNDASLHSPFGAGKLAADVMVQEYGRYFGLRAVCLRAGCVTGPAHAGTHLHGFLAYLVQCALSGAEYPIVGHGGKQVRDNLHADDLARMVLAIAEAPLAAEVYNVGGGRPTSCSVLEAITLVERLTGQRMNTRQVPEPRKGDHVWYISDTRRLRDHYPSCKPRYDLNAILEELCTAAARR
jgi:CDP-paratose 2-epimerase